MLLDVRKTGDVVALKLMSGEEVIGSFQSDSDGTITLRKPLAMAMTAQGPALAPWIASADIDKTSNFEINKDHVVTMVPAHKPIADAYTQATTGIDMSLQGTGAQLTV
jgi:hypothetical protein